MMFMPMVIALGQGRVVERSGKKPFWVNGTDKNFIIVSATGSSLTHAQRNTITRVKENIISAVVQRLRSSSAGSSQTAFHHTVAGFLENELPDQGGSSNNFLNSIDVQTLAGSYWEATQSGGHVQYHFHAKYPFTENDLVKLVNDFRTYDVGRDKKLSALLSFNERIEVIEDIERYISELRVLSEYFTDHRREKAREGMTRYRNLYNQIEIVEVHTTPGIFSYVLKLSNNEITTTQRPQITSDCARVTGTSSEGPVTTVNYEPLGCPAHHEKAFHIRYRFGQNDVLKRFNL
jgi:hypothetical protein